jgi:hypothetical protein
MEPYKGVDRINIFTAANVKINTKIGHLHYYMVETKLIPTAFRCKEAIGTKTCIAVH